MSGETSADHAMLRKVMQLTLDFPVFLKETLAVDDLMTTVCINIAHRLSCSC